AREKIKETKKLENLENQRANLKDGDPRASRLDDQIADSKEKIAGHQEKMSKLDQNVKATKYSASKQPAPHASNGHNLRNGLMSMAAMSLVDNVADVFEIDAESNRALSAVNNVADFSDSMFSAGFTALGGVMKAGLSAAVGKDWKSALSDGFSNAANTIAQSYKHNLVDATSRFEAHNTLKASQNDPELSGAIDEHNTNQNVQSLQNVQPNRALSLATRGGDMTFARNSKTGNLDVHMEGQAFAENTQVPFEQFQAMAQNPEQMQQFAQAVAKSNFDGQSGGGLASSQDLQQMKAEMDMNFQKNNYQIRRASNNTSMTAGMIEEQGEILQENISKTIEDVQQEVRAVNKKLEG
ncbi:MAG: hypothetical protein PHE78_08225, partial [Candidatus Gastranaerophilales bacterium]|nr:hypothetical protein [Candidatus Gastranaerophilales bacterium]